MDLSHLFREDEQPLDTLPPSGGFTSILRHVACIGDSLSSGEFEGTGEGGEKTYHDMFDHSWGQYLARLCGITVHNFSRGGMTAREYMNGWAQQMGYFDPALAAEAYVVALGVNDTSACAKGEMTFGEEADVARALAGETPDTFVGYYTAILTAYRAMRPDSYLFLVTMPREEDVPAERLPYRERHRALLHHLASTLPRTYVIDLFAHAPVYDRTFREHFYLGGHLNPMGYRLTADMIASYIDYIIRHNIRDFKQAGFIGTPYKNTADT